MKSADPIVEEVRRTKEAFAARFDYDIRRMFDYLKEKQKEHPERITNSKAAKTRVRPRA